MTMTIIGAVVAAIWLYLLAFRGSFWRLRYLPAAGEAAPVRLVVAVVPARDEAEVVARMLASLWSQDYPGLLHVVVVDDHSSDGTAAAALDAAGAAGAADRLTLAVSAPLPEGWSGKLWAMRQGIDIARRWRPDYLLLADADIVHGRHSLRDLVAQAETGGRDLVSLMVRLHCRGLWERLLIPAFVFFFFKLYPPRWVAAPRRGTAAAAGGCMLVRLRALDRIGGIDSIRHEIIDDCALARRIKGGGSIWIGATADSHSIREYRSWWPIWDMVARCAFAQLGYSTILLILAVVMMAVVYLIPPLLLLSGHSWAIGFGIAAWLAMSATYLPILRLYRCPLALAPLLPVTALFYASATVASAVQFWRGRGGRWKGRFQATSPV